jgi:CBS domain-containing protein
MILAIFNLVPGFPLDGGRMLRAALWYWKKDLRSATYIASRIGMGFGLVLMIVGGLSFIQGNFIGGMWWLLIGAFLRSAASASYQHLLVRQMLKDKPVSHFMNSNPVTVSPSTTIEELLKDYVYQHYFKMFPVVDNSKLLGCITVEDIKKIPQEKWAHSTVGEVTHPCSTKNTVSPNTNAGKLVASMARPNATARYMVVENDRLVGMVSLKDLREYIALKLELESPEV